ncbi:diguanylate cyclase [Thermanaerosceptrum fracticalcis]|uniref:Diguanylate cyclase n=1 Tax=Thermanaerosceptrum fracticalcis TaxID=1712410 RepID=A0A7G6E7M5_THEFR|nr:CHASE4 domain-containing protein [Thermanaerosceptrum fracticalcis]QNB48079.1 diguanylate cyclase [Thermanaerosceptrum fracticalcis]
MTLRKKTLILIAFFLIGLLLFVYFTSQFVLYNGYLELEERILKRNVDRGLNALQREIMTLNVTVGDWAFWDDSYQFVQNLSTEYINSNLTDPTFITNKLSLMMFINNSDEIVFSKGFDLINKKETDIPESSREMVRKKLFHFELSDKNMSKSGLISVPEGLFLVASRPILTSNYDGPSKGALVMARKFDDTELSILSDITQLTLTLKPIKELPDYASLRTLPDKNNNLISKIYDKDFITGYTVLKDIFDQPVMLLGVTAQREIYNQGLATLYFYIAIVFIAIVSFFTLIFLLLHKMVLSPIARLSAAVQKIAVNSDLSSRVPVEGKDEISSLAAEINKMLSVIENTQQELKVSKNRYRYLSYHDSLTGLYNRTFFDEEMARLNRDLKNYTPLSIICVDVDGLKLTNDTLGHRAGDDLLISFARLLAKPFRKTDVIARVGGDEFCIILPGTTNETAHIKAGEIIKLIEQYNANHSVIPISISVGIATSQGSESESIYDIYQAADNNMQELCSWWK